MYNFLAIQNLNTFLVVIIEFYNTKIWIFFDNGFYVLFWFVNLLHILIFSNIIISERFEFKFVYCSKFCFGKSKIKYFFFNYRCSLGAFINSLDLIWKLLKFHNYKYSLWSYQFKPWVIFAFYDYKYFLLSSFWFIRIKNKKNYVNNSK